MPRIIIELDCSDESDMEWLRNRAVPAVENEVVEAQDEGRLDGTVRVSWEIADDD